MTDEGGVMARLKTGALVDMAGGEWTERAGGWEPGYGVVLQVRDHDGACLVRFDDDGRAGWLRWADLREVSEDLSGSVSFSPLTGPSHARRVCASASCATPSLRPTSATH